MATFRIWPLLALICAFQVSGIIGQDCFNPFYRPPYCYGGFGYDPFPFGGGFGYPGFGFGFGPYFGPGSQVYGGGVGTGVGFSTSFGGEGKQPRKPSSSKSPSAQSKRPYFDEGFARPGFGGFYGPGYGGFGGFYGGPFGGFGFGPGFNPYIPPVPQTLRTSGPGFRTSSGTSTFSFGPGGTTQTSSSNQLVTTEADDGTWTIQSSGLPLSTDVDQGTILVIGSVGKPTKVDRDAVSKNEVQFNFSYKDEPKKWINLKSDKNGPDVAGVTIEEKGDSVYIRGPPGKKASAPSRRFAL